MWTRYGKTHRFALPNLILCDHQHFLLHVRDSDQARRRQTFMHHPEVQISAHDVRIFRFQNIPGRMVKLEGSTQTMDVVSRRPVSVQLQGIQVPVAVREVLQRFFQRPEWILELHIFAILPIEYAQLSLLVLEQRVKLSTYA